MSAATMEVSAGVVDFDTPASPAELAEFGHQASWAVVERFDTTEDVYELDGFRFAARLEAEADRFVITYFRGASVEDREQMTAAVASLREGRYGRVAWFPGDDGTPTVMLSTEQFRDRPDALIECTEPRCVDFEGVHELDGYDDQWHMHWAFERATDDWRVDVYRNSTEPQWNLQLDSRDTNAEGVDAFAIADALTEAATLCRQLNAGSAEGPES